MAFKTPPLGELRKIAQLLKKKYKGTNPQRLSFIELLDSVTNATISSSDSTATNVIMGALTTELEVLKNECYFSFSTPGSTLYAEIIEALKISKENPLGDDERLVFTHDFQEHVKKLFSDSTMQVMRKNLQEKKSELIWKNKDALVNYIHKQTISIRKRDAHRINQLVHTTPSLEALRKSTKNLAHDYLDMANAVQSTGLFGKDPKRDELANFIDLMDRSCSFVYYQSPQNTQSEELRRKLMEDESAARRGLLLFVLLQINKTYKWLSPKGGWFNSGSKLFKEALQALNVNDLDDITPMEKAEYLRALQELIKLATAIPERWEAFLENEIIKVGITPLRTDAELYKNELTSFIYTEDQLKYNFRGHKKYVSTAVDCAAQSATTFVLSSGTASYAVKGIIGAAAMSAGGIPAVAVYAGGSLVVSGLHALVGQNLVSAATASMYSWLLDKVGAIVGAATLGACNLSYEVSNETLHTLRMQLKPEDDKLFCDWVNTLLDESEDVVSKNEKIGIRTVFGLDVGKLLLPLHQHSYSAPILRRS